jgi:hypothetical protein
MPEYTPVDQSVHFRRFVRVEEEADTIYVFPLVVVIPSQSRLSLVILNNYKSRITNHKPHQRHTTIETTALRSTGLSHRHDHDHTSNSRLSSNSMSPTEATFRHQQQQQQNSSIYPAPQVPYSDNPQGHQRISSLSSQGMHDEVGGVQRGQVGAGYGPYAVSTPRSGCCSL